ncbi:MAG: hypothetical protein H7145_07150 [Akkermansiaceae bacterium]|nr:hypothetical protein [Armatimonadota bacterium]
MRTPNTIALAFPRRFGSGGSEFGGVDVCRATGGTAVLDQLFFEGGDWLMGFSGTGVLYACTGESAGDRLPRDLC